MVLVNKTLAITGGTGYLGHILIERILTGEIGFPQKIIIFSRDENKQYQMKIKYSAYNDILEFRVGDIRDYESIIALITDSDIIIHAAALKQIPVCESFPFESVKTNILGTQNIIRAIKEFGKRVESILIISTDKACKPVNVYGMCKAIQERLILSSHELYRNKKFLCVRYGNIINSTSSIIPLFKEQIKHGGPVTITSKEMTRFLIGEDQAIDLIFEILDNGESGKIYIPNIPSAKIIDIANIMINNRKIDIKIIGIRPGEKIHEILISSEELERVVKSDNYYIIQPGKNNNHILEDEYSSNNNLLEGDDLVELLRLHGCLDF